LFFKRGNKDRRNEGEKIREEEQRILHLARKSQILKDLAFSRTVQRITPIKKPTHQLFWEFLCTVNVLMDERYLRIREQENYGFYQISVSFRNIPKHQNNHKVTGPTGLASDWFSYRSKPENLYENWSELEEDVKFQLLKEESELLLLADSLQSLEFNFPEEK